jgi:hypothetical protein
MNPKPPISAEGLAAKNRIAEVRQNVNLGATPAEARATVRQVEAGPAPRLNPTIPQIIPSTALAGNKTFEDVMDTRADLETQATAKQQLTDRIKGTTDRVGATAPTAFSDPDAIINRLALNRVPTETENQRKQAFDTAQQNRRDYAGDIATARTQANEQFGVPDLVARKAEVTQQYAEREAKMDNDIKRLEENASKRGVPRQYVDAEKQKIKSDALEDLANYAAIEAAVSGSITEARSIINDTINDKKASFILENQAIQQEIDYLSTLVGEDNQREASQLQIALNERKAAQDAQLAKETEIKELMVNVASEGADDGTINAIKNATSVEEAIRYASPFLGRTERMQANASIRASNASAARNETGRLLDLAEAGDIDAITQLGLTTSDNTVPTADEIAYAQQYASTGQIPTGLSTAGISFGRIQELAADLPKPDGALVSTPTGVAPSNLNDTQKAGIVAMSEIVNETLPNMQKLWEQAQMTNLGGTGIVGGIASKVIPTEAMTLYLQARDEFLSKLLVARSGAAVTEQEYDRYSKLVPTAFNSSFFLGSGGDTKLTGLQNLMTTDLDNKLNSSQLSIYGYSKVKAGNDTYTVGEIITNEYGQSGKVNPDGSITLIN